MESGYLNIELESRMMGVRGNVRRSMKGLGKITYRKVREDKVRSAI